LQEQNTPPITQTFSSGREIVREAYLKKGVPEMSVDFIVDSISKSTLKQYEGCLKKWIEFATRNKYDIFDPTSSNVIEFLTMRFNENASYGTLNSSRSAISLITKSDISNDAIISRFFKGIYRRRPSAPKYSETWNIEQVLEYIENQDTFENLNLKIISEIATTLLVLITAHRLQTIALINIDEIIMGSDGLQIKIPDRIKTSKLGKNQPLLVIPFFKKRPKVCVATIILHYLKITEPIRAGNKKLFLASVKPHKPVSAQTIGHWIKSLLGKAGIDTDKFSAYSTKHASVSTAYRKGIDIDTIRRTAGWTEGSGTFARFYNRPLTEPNDKFAISILTKDV
jgi:site-specific recombinase XerD